MRLIVGGIFGVLLIIAWERIKEDKGNKSLNVIILVVLILALIIYSSNPGKIFS